MPYSKVVFTKIFLNFIRQLSSGLHDQDIADKLRHLTGALRPFGIKILWADLRIT